MFFNESARAVAAAGAQKFKNLHAKSREFRPQNCAISVPTVRAGRKKCAQTHSKGFKSHATHCCASGQGFAGAGRVSRAKIALKLIETLAILTKHHGF